MLISGLVTGRPTKLARLPGLRSRKAPLGRKIKGESIWAFSPVFGILLTAGGLSIAGFKDKNILTRLSQQAISNAWYFDPAYACGANRAVPDPENLSLYPNNSRPRGLNLWPWQLNPMRKEAYPSVPTALCKH